MCKKLGVAVVVLTAGIAAMSSSASASTFYFGDISIANGATADGDPYGDGLGQYMSFDLSDYTGVIDNAGNPDTNDTTARVLFNFHNLPVGADLSTNLATDSVITGIYFDVQGDVPIIGTGSGDQHFVSKTVNPGGSVNFVFGDSGQSLPQGGNLNPPFSLDFKDVRATGQGFNVQDGLNVGESLGIAITGTYQTVLNALANKSLRIGLHVQALPDYMCDDPNDQSQCEENPSDSYINFGNPNQVGPDPDPIPLPAALPLLLSALGALGFAGWRRRKTITV